MHSLNIIILFSQEMMKSSKGDTLKFAVAINSQALLLAFQFKVMDDYKLVITGKFLLLLSPTKIFDVI